MLELVLGRMGAAKRCFKHQNNISIPKAVQYGGCLFFGDSPINKKWLITRFILFICSLLITSWSITYYILNNKLIEWTYWINNWSSLLSTIYLSLSFILTYKIYKFIKKQRIKQSSYSHTVIHIH